jgi:hypothetical protein
MPEKNSHPCGWSGSIHDFLSLAKADWLAALQVHHQRCVNCPADQSQLPEWDHEFDLLAKQLKQLLQVKPALGSCTIIFEYELPDGRGGRPDVIILGACVFVLEFRDLAEILQTHVDQLEACARDLERYPTGSHQYTVVPILILTRAKELIRRDGDIIILSPDRIADVLTVQSELETGPLIDPVTWITAGYSPRAP